MDFALQRMLAANEAREAHEFTCTELRGTVASMQAELSRAKRHAQTSKELQGQVCKLQRQLKDARQEAAYYKGAAHAHSSDICAAMLAVAAEGSSGGRGHM